MKDKLRFILNRIGERLWVKPLFVCLVSIAIAFIAQWADQFQIFQKAPEVNTESIEMLLEVISASMLVMAVFAVGSMLAAYQSASNSATPRAFTLVVSDDVSQNALSTFIGAFIFSIVAQVALLNGYYEKAGRFILFIITIVVFVLVIINFIKWVDGIARLGRLGTTIAKVEKATAEALRRRREKPFLGGTQSDHQTDGLPVFPTTVGYIQRIDMDALQTAAKNGEMQIIVATLPGAFVAPNRPLAYLRGGRDAEAVIETASIVNAFFIGNQRTFDDDPRFGLITLSEIASRALSPAVNDPGTAIQVTGIFVRLFAELAQEISEQELPRIEYDRVAVPEIPLSDLFEDAFNAIARDGAGTIEVVLRTLKALATLTSVGNEKMEAAALESARLVIAHAQESLSIPSDIEKLQAVSEFARSLDSGE
ncbi:DUF2254 domain-containing protein [uncultured Marinobacter sp.]|uniref:DUF2254 domain-containing protein n=1 Tax=uncultured Marinobacter sp. TaxID=187379 RepID=UPI00262F37F8|nr:DUF2254 domain-containing protein [uncultured Marinobacter sp.]